MPISIRYKNDPSQECVIRPAPLVSVSEQALKNELGAFGKTYSITLNGYIIVDLGFPLARDSRDNSFFNYWNNVPAVGNCGPYLAFNNTQSHLFSESSEIDNRPERQYVPYESALDAMFFKQKVLRELFNRDGQRLEIIPINMDEATVVCYPRFVSISFEDGIYTDYCKYTINLEADVLLNKDEEIDLDGSLVDNTDNYFTTSLTEEEMFALKGRFIQSYSDDWSLDSNSDYVDSNSARSYTITRTISATGKDHYGPTDLNTDGIKNPNKIPAWQQARDFVQFRLNNGPVESGYPNFRGVIGSGLLNLVNSYRGFNRVVNEKVNPTDGSYSVTETWLLSSGIAYESYNSSVNVSIDNPFVSVSMTGKVKGLNAVPVSGTVFGGNLPSSGNVYQNALDKYYQISNSGKFGVGSDIFKRADSLIGPQLNAQPKSIAVSYNEIIGEIDYSVEFDNRPVNILSGVLSEDISISDTYPGDVFATITIPGRTRGPILQPIGTRTEYKRDLSINFNVDYTDIPYGSGRTSLLLQKPSIVEPIRTQLINLIREFSPEKETGIVKYYISAPVENWTPKNGAYSLQLSWTYEINR
jgi:hypothetical protein